MSSIVVEGGARLQGTVGVRGAKNAVLKEMVAALLAPGRHRLDQRARDPRRRADGPRCSSTSAATCERATASSSWLVSPTSSTPRPPSSWCAGCGRRSSSSAPCSPAAARRRVALPGGDDLGARPIDMHLERPGGDGGRLPAGPRRARRAGSTGGSRAPRSSCPSLRWAPPRTCCLRRCLAEGETMIINAAREPEISDLVDQLASDGRRDRGWRHVHPSTVHGVGVSAARSSTG